MSEPALNLPPNRVAPDRVCRIVLEFRARMRAQMERVEALVEEITNRTDGHDDTPAIPDGPGPARA